ncbi:MAG: hypothetical protein ACI82O_004440 [Patiriisocius sp.]
MLSYGFQTERERRHPSVEFYLLRQYQCIRARTLAFGYNSPSATQTVKRLCHRNLIFYGIYRLYV